MTATIAAPVTPPRWALCACCYYMPPAAQATFTRFFLIPQRPGTGRALRVEGPADLEATLAAADIISPAEALRRLEADHRAAAAEQSAEVRSPSS